MTAAGRPQREGSSIGAVLAQLRPDFPDVTISKIRFLESEGLVRPARTPSGYRQFGPADVERLRFVLAAQRDHYLPLRVIKEQLDAADRGEGPASTGTPRPRPPRKLVAVDSGDDYGQAPGLPGPERFAAEPGDEAVFTPEDLQREAGIDAAMLSELCQFGLVKPSGAGYYDADAVRVAHTVKAMSDYGIEPRHLRAFRASADREVGLVEQIVAPVLRHRDADARARAEETVRELAALSVTLHTLLVKTGIRGVTGG
ncbi:MerR family transcriptional regulator [Saccharomonospora piscinae]|uniref:transcriptional regulator FtsR n=1 Tax=Saccharomonospora piscinae TaxID=687388 RepID=UPI000565690E|nr:MerR family transcriptional regulator [Saccharomonospora piscinae]